MISVHIVISDRSWILERLAAEIACRLDYVTYDTDPDPSADIQYYMTYSTRRGLERVSPVEIAFFTHLEEFHEEAQEWYWRVAGEVDHRVCMSKPYVQMFREHGFESGVSLISPGVDHNRFTPKLRIGVVGRTYATGRKGEGLVQAVMDIPEIDWHFTGTGWPGPARFIPEGQLPDFYRSMDYILVPAYYEGGPMCVLEALACGVEVIAPPVGWVPDYPYIEFKTGDAEDLRRILLELIQQRKALAATVSGVSWDEWARRHDVLFRELAAERLPGRLAAGDAQKPRSVALWVSGLEKQAKGGPTVRVKNTVRALRKLGVQARQVENLSSADHAPDIIHAFNVAPPEETASIIFAAKRTKTPVVVSPILLDYSERAVYTNEIPKVFAAGYSARDIDRMLATLREKRAREVARGGGLKEPGVGYFSKLIAILDSADHVICLSQKERRLVAAIGAEPRAVSIVHNATAASLYAEADPALFEQRYGVKDFVLCVGRKEARKNQLMLLYALRDEKVPVVLIGHEHEPDKIYLEQLHRFAGRNVLLLDRLEPNSPMLASAYAASRVFVLPSWSEGAPLVALEAAAAGCNLVLSNRSSEQEYFGEFARFCDPGDPGSIRATVLEAYPSPPGTDARDRQKSFMLERYSWERYARETLEVYEKTLATRQEIVSVSLALEDQPRIYVDLTTSGERKGTPTGVPRVERMYALELKRRMPCRVHLVKWHKQARAYLPVSLEQVLDNSYSGGVATYDYPERNGSAVPYSYVDFVPGSILLVLGGTWNADGLYLHDLIFTKRLRRLQLITCIYDMIPAQFPHFTAKSYFTAFEKHVKTVISVSDKLLAISNCTARAVSDFAIRNRLMMPEIELIRLGDEIEQIESVDLDKIAALKQQLGDRPFVLTVSTITPRKNFDLLYQVWLRLLEQFGKDAPQLVIVGREGYNATSLMTTLRDDINVQGHIHIMHDVGDDVLRWLYCNCLFTVYPTLYEGWGMPVAESLAYSKVCIASDIASVPEIAPELTDLIDPMDFPTWYETITGYIRDVARRERREREISERYRPTTWDSAAQELARILSKPVVSSSFLPELRPGSRVSYLREPAAGDIKSSVYQSGGWSTPEDNGTWTVGTVAALAFSRIPTDAPYLVLCADTEPFRPKGQMLLGNIEVVLNDRRISTWSLQLGGYYRAVFPATLAAKQTASSCNILEFRIPNPVCPKDVGLGNDARALGMRFKSIEVVPTVPLTVDGKLDFTASGPVAAGLCAAGWCAAGPRGLMMTGYSAVLVLKLARADSGPTLLSLNIAPFQLVGIDPVEVEISVGGQLVGLLQVGCGPAHAVRAVLPEFPQELLLVEFSISRGINLGGENIQYDSKVRSIYLERISVEPLSEAKETGARYQTGTPIAFGIEGNAEVYTLNGWCAPQVGGTWTEGNDAYLGLRIAPEAKMPSVLRARCVPAVNALSPVLNLDLRVNGTRIQSWRFNQETETEIEATLPDGILGTNGRILLQFHVSEPRSAKELGLGLDPRRLGVLMKQLGLYSKE